ncbi:cytochrome P450 [Azospirillum sp. SYSU D00513]|uniref:cytochrome P450 n=1 Tax=Azospirillum sp. SYSU D00513 TaxID=2812561 RepID=UPI001A96ABC7|nr:cytochrome P450 [Azospirillum sp. SYSU D00513]
MAQIPRDSALDSTLSLLSEGYRFIPERCRRYRSDLFETRLMLRRAVCISGEEAARLFYDTGRFTRNGAMPQTTLRLLQDKGSVQTLDGEAHRVRKRMFLSLVAPEALRRMREVFAAQWRSAIPKWQDMGEAVLFPEAREILCRGVCAWAGLPLGDEEARQRTAEFGAMIDGAGSAGPRAWRGLLLRSKTERWARGVIDRVRAGDLKAPEGSAVQLIAAHRDADGSLLDRSTAAVELINLLRPTVAVDRYIVFAALALHEHPEFREQLASPAATDEDRERFVQEVRRFYPFFPFVGGRVTRGFTWKGHDFAEGAWVLLDLHGTNHDPRLWEEPETFRPDRFRAWNGSPFNFIPQGAGDVAKDHRCPGERLTIELVKEAVALLTGAMRYEVPEQDLTIDLSRVPAIPKSRFVIRNVRSA